MPNSSGGDKQEETSPDNIVKHPLQNDWQLWYWRKEDSKSWEESLLEVTTFSSVEDFWALYNHIELASKLGHQADYSVFKCGIKPMWEDPRNSRGGRWIIPFDRNAKKELDEMWLEVLLCLIGEAFGEESDQICGGVISNRRSGSRIAVWTSDYKDQDAVKKIGQILKERTNYMGHLFYEKHDDGGGRSRSNGLYQV
ncbi:eukaryotic translation initiation factor 4E-like isoform X2 [Brevipalpus obovatus]|uniref:eukaryotic translation initiation factor 4E-like isoform X2 n=1 Tax=Brevipalpus obovatus TaxID=246614 RepID=UPI003D9F7514